MIIARTVAGAVWLLAAGPALAAQDRPLTALDRALQVFDSAEVERAVELMRQAIATLPPTVSPATRLDAYIHLATAHLALDERDQATTHFQTVTRLDAFFEPDTLRFNPEVIAAFHQARRTTAAVGIRVPEDATVTPGSQDAWPVTLAVGRPGRVRVWLAPLGGGDTTTVLNVAVDQITTIPVSFEVAEVGGLAPGPYQLGADFADAVTGSTVRQLELDLERSAVDSLPHEAALPDSLFRPETRPGPPKWVHALKGAGFGLLAASLPLVIGRDQFDDHLHREAIATGVAVGVGGIIGSFLGRAKLPIAENIAYNTSLRTQREERNRGIAEANAAQRRAAPLRLRLRNTP